LFSVPDFVGDACKAIASRIRGAVAGVQFDDFHKVCIVLAFYCFISMTAARQDKKYCTLIGNRVNNLIELILESF